MMTVNILSGLIQKFGDYDTLKFKYEKPDKRLDRLKKICSFIFAYNVSVKASNEPLKTVPRELIYHICDELFYPDGGISIGGNDFRIICTEEEENERLHLLLVNTVKGLCTL